MKYFKLSIVLLFLVCADLGQGAKFIEQFKWKEVSFAWPSELAKEEAIVRGWYIPVNNPALGLDLWRDKLFITVPRLKFGVASSLNYIKLSSAEVSPALVPYPSWNANIVKSNETKGLFEDSSIISTVRIFIDECDRLWVMDTGIDNINGKRNLVAPAALVIFDLNTDTLIRRYTFQPSDIKETNLFTNVVVDIPNHECENAFAYVTDSGVASAVVVYSYKSNKSWRVQHHYFHFDPLSGNHNVRGTNFQWDGGVIGIALGRQSNDGSRTVYFHALASNQEFSVPNVVLQNETRALSKESYYDYSLVGDRGPNGQSLDELFDEKSNVLFYTQFNKDGVFCWNANKPYNPDTQGLVDADSETLVFPNDLKIDEDDNLWVLSDRISDFDYNKLNPKDYNYRILSAKVSDLIADTVCAPERTQFLFYPSYPSYLKYPSYPNYPNYPFYPFFPNQL